MAGHEAAQTVKRTPLARPDRHAGQVQLQVGGKRFHAGIAPGRFFADGFEYDAVEIRRMAVAVWRGGDGTGRAWNLVAHRRPGLKHSLALHVVGQRAG